MRKIEKYNEPALQNLDNGIEDELKKVMNNQLTLLDFIDVWLQLFKKNSLKIASYNRLITAKNALSYYEISKMRICDISFFDIQRYINALVESGYSLTNIKKQVLIVTAPLKQAAAMKVINADPSVGIQMPIEETVKKKAKEVIAYTKEEQEKLWRKISMTPENVGYAAVAFQIETGLRAGELLALKWTDVNINQCKMRIHATIVDPQYTNKASYQDSAKSKTSNRSVPLTPKAIAILKRLRENSHTEWVFEKYNDRLSYQQLLSRLMGHSSVQVTYNIYINLYGDGFDDMYAALCF